MLSDAVNSHIELYRSMGFKYRVQAYMLRSFAAFAERQSELFIRTETVLKWAGSAPSVRQRYDRLLIIRRLACALKAEDERHEVPLPTSLVVRRSAVEHATFLLRTKSIAFCGPLDN